MVPERIEVDGESMTIAWSDGLIAELAAADVRAACECAACREPSGMEATRAVLAGDRPITVTEASLVGGYAVTFTFSPDGHRTGIFTYSLLRSLSSPTD